MIIKISDKLRDDKGVTLITLIIAITTFAVFITVFSYVMVAKHRASALYVQSTQAYTIAQAGIEYGIRYATDNATGPTGFFANPNNYFPINDKIFGDGTFTLDYININDPDNPNSLKSTGEIGVAEREIILQNFAGWVTGQAITLAPGVPPTRDGTIINVPLINNYGESVDIYMIKLAKTGDNPAPLEIIEFDGTTVWAEEPPVDVSIYPTEFSFDFDYTMEPGSSYTLSLIADNAAHLKETWRCTFCYNPSDQWRSVEFCIDT